ncbi:2-oxo-3-deoxygalactonate kinase [Shimwellia blattae DSM 4481 = NBRC 105725]|uniref:2-oxo-3-deoxygalactonate kinase n=1 Tax=Shimwellia blattae (strain ATCC 29907 / DSM 4481 / JCM 1650 / NBRC 105725 / CDC 9005-74) TaxID=630626 RepID=I2B3N9_SHIBC|nr:2-dehydro-3-deoxygalactonokinase [Shimwellia blattae]AFJ45143.1 2-oxo-3-deoxygalactonate kinase [Shimwellia blattae DSM 4481 = NBRC 105725]GAB82368.1 2-dehydro-3-deoxygalactonokinase [Shimwellia blattae DSM 4481 = NBRC 105725]VEC19322.1 2-keto-3-deoxy-galactonokinase [Shimwellia blattae]
MTSRYIAIDWGSTNLRAWLYQDGQCLDSRQSEAGITRLNGRTPAAVLETITTGWRAPDTPVLMAGMVGSDAGWKTAPYLPCPVALSDIATRLTPVVDNVWIVPGLSTGEAAHPNVMRGEETQLLGACQVRPAAYYVMPGTHCKWVSVQGQQVTDFHTVMTGELHYLLMSHSLLGKGLPEQVLSQQAFDDGLENGLNNPALLARLFEVRAAHVLGTLPREAVSDYLSGLLIGAEVATMTRNMDRDPTITLVAGSGLIWRYRRAFTALGYSAQAISGDEAFQAGIRSIADAVAHSTSADSHPARG